MRSDFYGLPWAAQQAIRRGESESSRARRQAYSMAELEKALYARNEEIAALKERLGEAIEVIQLTADGWKLDDPEQRLQTVRERVRAFLSSNKRES